MNSPDTKRPDTAVIASELARTLPGHRYFADKASTLNKVEVVIQEPLLPATETHPAVDLLFVRAHVDGGTPAYQLPIAWTDRVPSCGEQAVLVDAEGLVGYDALADADVVTALGAALIKDGALGSMRMHHVPGGADIAVPESGRPMGAEQSNTSVVYDEKLMCKFFRRLHPGTNADVELLAALSAAGCTSVPRLHGWTELDIDGDVYTTAMVQEFVPNSAEGWAMALTSVRDIIREGDLQPADLGTDFASESRALGGAVASVHETLASSVPVSEKLSGEELVAPMLARLDHVAGVVPQVAEQADRVRAVYRDAAAAVGPDGVPAQRVHGDLHLGQVLRTPREWLLIDFEGEPSRPWDERRLPDHPLRDVAGMVRSFDYAAHYPLLTARENSRQHQYRVTEWAERNIDAFLDGYAQQYGADPRKNEALLTAFILDKAIYECLYEAQNRPEWLQLPLAAVQRLLAA
ncbi:phosphotransferase [Corynebacterium sp. TAE3-ERU12]|uniref:maltokinase N-terminal cap-like domain-containing protein n=1 Tax=Corynebacterium sp. TAE3-ERU12 TaxID=2849491 RepID=UPI001C46A501|nr:phosphotransferase [Corynebacterium sp. TAE3-ERU12]MBV7295758.1 phosphotransferase [Corynebacterium sp. TAE3-ERU12]